MTKAIAAITTLLLLGLFLAGQLAIWHLYVTIFINGGFSRFGAIAYRASIKMLVRPEQYVRANSMDTAMGLCFQHCRTAPRGAALP